jgi:hypothetical protein
MTINNPKLYMDTHWDWACLDGCFGSGIRPSDVDGIVEVNGHFLLMETKSPSAHLSIGQRRMFLAFPGLVIVVWGEPGAPKEMLVLDHGDEVRPLGTATLDDFRKRVRAWFLYANGCPRNDHAVTTEPHRS